MGKEVLTTSIDDDFQVGADSHFVTKARAVGIKTTTHLRDKYKSQISACLNTKDVQLDIMKELNIPFPKSLYVKDWHGLMMAINRFKSNLILKPINGAKCMSIYKFNSKDIFKFNKKSQKKEAPKYSATLMMDRGQDHKSFEDMIQDIYECNGNYIVSENINVKEEYRVVLFQSTKKILKCNRYYYKGLNKADDFKIIENSKINFLTKFREFMKVENIPTMSIDIIVEKGTNKELVAEFSGDYGYQYSISKKTLSFLHKHKEKSLSKIIKKIKKIQQRGF